jgi:hypothetical protein
MFHILILLGNMKRVAAEMVAGLRPAMRRPHGIVTMDFHQSSYFSSAAVEVAGPSPMIRRTASSSLAPSQCTCLAKWVTKLPVGIGVVYFHQMHLCANNAPAAPWTKSQQEVGADWSASGPRRSAFEPILGPGIGA